MNYWKKVELENWQPNVQKIYAYFNRYNKSETSRFRNTLPLEKISKEFPSFITSLEKFGKANQILVLVINRYDTLLHDDAMCSGPGNSIKNEARLQIPILNAESSTTFFYDRDDLDDVPRKLVNLGSGHFSWDKAALNVKQPVTSTVIDQPTILRIREPHYVICNKLPRIVLSIGITNDIVQHLV